MGRIEVSEAFHCSIKAIQRSKGRSEVTAAAYIAGVKFNDLRTGQVHDFTNRAGVLHTQIFLPANLPAGSMTPQALLDALNRAAPRGDAVAMREVIAALPSELSGDQRQALGAEFVKWLVGRFHVAAYAAWHAPSETGDQRNFHMHILLSAKVIDPSKPHGFGRKVAALDPIAASRAKPPIEPAAREIRRKLAEISNRHLEAAGLNVRVDARSLAARRQEALLMWDLHTFVELLRAPTTHIGPRKCAKDKREISTSGESRPAVMPGDLEHPVTGQSELATEDTVPMRPSPHNRKLPLLAAIHGRRMKITEEPSGETTVVGPRTMLWTDRAVKALSKSPVAQGRGISWMRAMELSDGKSALAVGLKGEEVCVNEDRVVLCAEGSGFSRDAVFLAVALARVAGWPAIVTHGDVPFVEAVRKQLSDVSAEFANVAEIASFWFPWTQPGYPAVMQTPYCETRWSGDAPPEHTEFEP